MFHTQYNHHQVAKPKEIGGSPRVSTEVGVSQLGMVSFNMAVFASPGRLFGRRWTVFACSRWKTLLDSCI